MTRLPPETVIVRLNTDPSPPAALGRVLWCSRPQRRRSNARQLAGLAVQHCADRAAWPKCRAVRDGTGWRGVVYAGRRTRREREKQIATAASAAKETR